MSRQYIVTVRVEDVDMFGVTYRHEHAAAFMVTENLLTNAHSVELVLGSQVHRTIERLNEACDDAEES